MPDQTPQKFYSYIEIREITLVCWNIKYLWVNQPGEPQIIENELEKPSIRKALKNREKWHLLNIAVK